MILTEILNIKKSIFYIIIINMFVVLIFLPIIFVEYYSIDIYESDWVGKSADIIVNNIYLSLSIIGNIVNKINSRIFIFIGYEWRDLSLIAFGIIIGFFSRYIRWRN